MTETKVLLILHFNDVYELSPRKQEPVGGAARFATRIREFQASNPLVLFSGDGVDCFNPSMLSTFTKGKQMVEVLNSVGVAAAGIGNHDFDYGLDNFLALSAQCSFPWIMSNVMEKDSGRPLGGAKQTLLLEWQGVKVGLLGLVEPEWLETLPVLDPETLVYTDFVEEGHRLARQLREEGADVIIALTHMRIPNDRVLAAEVQEIDLVLGGHDHEYSAERSLPHGIPLVKSGTDFRDLTAITLTLRLPQQQQQHSNGAAKEEEEVLQRRAAAVKLVAASRQMGSMVLRRRTFTHHLKSAARVLGSMGRGLAHKTADMAHESAKGLSNLVLGRGREESGLVSSDLSAHEEKPSREAGEAGAAAGSVGADQQQQQQQQPAGPGDSSSSGVLAEEEKAAESLAEAMAMAAAPPAAVAAALRCERPGSSGRAVLQWECRRLSVTGDVAEDPEVAEIVKRHEEAMGSTMGDVVGYTAVDLDGRFASVRTKETNLGNFLCDVLRDVCHCDVVLLNSGTLRSDAVHPAGKLTNKDLISILPMLDETVVIEVTGAQLLAALENGVSQYPMHEGRFPQVSGIQFAFDPSQSPLSRVVPGSVKVNSVPLELDTLYSLGTKEYLSLGKDGYDSLAGSRVLLDSECCPMLPTAVRNYFTVLAVVNKWVDPPSWRRAASHFRRSIKSRQQPEAVADAGASKGASHAADLDPITGLYQIKPLVDGRVRNVQQEA